eukprot:TRINITY_DN36444_c0_g1_i1.p1 TRINITY_DN36444_c0_g1~~TRINITY_DN36444_c0_g1_i1.p1  ORF type:complete len:355 (-),score=33.67 TRINITY_DN36444_c0_g1_i1:305-1369(-)
MSVLGAKEVVEAFDSCHSGLEDTFYFRRRVAAVLGTCVAAGTFGKQCLTLSTECPESVDEVRFCEIWPLLIWYSRLIHLCVLLYFCAWIYAFRYSPEDLGPVSKAKWAHEIPFLQCMLLVCDAAPDYVIGGHLQIVSNVVTLAVSAFFILPLILGPVNRWVILLGTTCPYVVSMFCVQWLGKFPYEDVAFSVLSVERSLFSLHFFLAHVCVLGGLGILVALGRNKEGKHTFLEKVAAAQSVDEAPPAAVKNGDAWMTPVPSSTASTREPPSSPIAKPQTDSHMEQDVELFEPDDSGLYLSDMRPHTSVHETHRKSSRRITELVYGRAPSQTATQVSGPCHNTLNVVPTLSDQTA